jgi:hypothetical protein
MKYFLVEEEGNYCGYDDKYLIKTDKDEKAADDFACEHADERTAEEATFYLEEDEDEELHIGFDMEEITEEQFNEYVGKGYSVNIV